ncbi:hypothetical protein LTR53_000026 [Teratosphaeriaceae sp. CCFEE 6253]|nr:hypothetical protein LTR53_000026 [Teratosphaeriaceae sp. CCFEE 6253]
MPGGCAKVDPRQNQKRVTASTPGGDEESSLTKRRRLNLSDGRSDGIHDRAKITERAVTDFLAMAESDGTDCSRFRYYGALASTSGERCRLTAISGEQQHILRLIRLTWKCWDGMFSVSAIRRIDWQRHTVEQFTTTGSPDAAAEDGITYGD